MTRSAARRELRVDAILDSAIRAFRQQGYHGTSMERIADRLLMTKGSLYYYFRNKQEILFAAHDRALDRILAELARVKRAGGCPCDQLADLLAAHIKIMVEGFQGTALALEFGALSPRRLRTVIDKRDRYEHALRGMIKDGAKKGCLRGVDPKLAGMALLGSINWIARWHRAGGPAGADEVAGRFLDLFMDGMKPHRPVTGRARAGAGQSSTAGSGGRRP